MELPTTVSETVFDWMGAAKHSFRFCFVAGWGSQQPFQKRFLVGGAADSRSRNGFWLDGRIQKQFQKRLLVGVCSQPPFQKRFFAGGVQPNTVSDMGGQPNTVSEMVLGRRG